MGNGDSGLLFVMVVGFILAAIIAAPMLAVLYLIVMTFARAVS